MPAALDDHGKEAKQRDLTPLCTQFMSLPLHPFITGKFCYHIVSSYFRMIHGGSTLFYFEALIRDIVHCYVFWINNLCATGNMSQTSEWPMRTKTAVRPKLLSLRT